MMTRLTPLVSLNYIKHFNLNYFYTISFSLQYTANFSIATSTNVIHCHCVLIRYMQIFQGWKGCSPNPV